MKKSSSRKYRVVFFGTPEFGVPCLNALVSDTRFDIVGAFTQPDTRQGRHQTLTPSPIKQTALALEIPVYQPKQLDKHAQNLLENLAPEIMIVVAYGKLIPGAILQIPPFGALNVHPSLLPKYRGPSPIASALLHGEKETGITIILLDEDMDHGPMLAQEKTRIREDEDAVMLSKRLAILAAPLLQNTLASYMNHEIEPQPQDHRQATFCNILKREDGKLPVATAGASEMLQRIRAFQPWPGAFFHWNGRKLAILSARRTNRQKGTHASGVLIAEHDRLFLAAQDQFVEILSLQPENKKAMSAKDFIHGYLKPKAEDSTSSPHLP